ncbi:MAG: hypothetical protein ACRDE8_09605 [Ginsengibacter sp.]
MKKITSIAIAFLFTALAAKAQIKREVDSSQTKQSTVQKTKNGKMMKELNLSKEQRSQMKELHQSMKQQKETISNDSNLTDAEKQTKLRTLKKEQREKMESILTPEQKEKLKEEKKQSKKT